MKVIACIVLALTLAGCVTDQEREQQMFAAIEQCKSSTKTRVERTRCANEADNRIFGGETPLMAYKHAEALRIAVRIDKGEITPQEGEAEFQKAMAQLKM